MSGLEELIVLGTGNAMATRCFNTCFLLRAGEEYMLVDTGGGNGILAALENAAIDPAKIHSLFLTHAHTDHILGFPWIVRRIGTLMKNGGYEGKLTVYGHDEVCRAMREICALTVQKKFTALFDDKIVFKTLTDGCEDDILGCRATFFDIRSTKAKQFGVSLLSGEKKIVCLGDEPCDPLCEQYAQNADWLLCEAFCLYSDRERFSPYEKHHSTAADAAALAQRLGVRRLVLWHTEDKTLKTRKAAYCTEAKAHFSGEVYVPYDLERITL